MDDRDLRVFVTLAQTLHFGQAAALCHLSTSAVSRVVQRLEAAVGEPLLVRDSRQVTLTPAGQRFRAFARETLTRWDALRRSVQSGDRALAGEVRLYCSVTASYRILSALLPAFRERFPGIHVTLHTGDQAASVQRALQQQEDLVIAARPERLPPSLSFLPLTTTPLVFIAPAEGAAWRSGAVDWQSVPFIVPEAGLSRERLDDWFRASGQRPRVYAEVSGHEAIVSMVSLGFGVGVVPALVLADSPRAAAVTVLDDAPRLPEFTIGLCAHRRRLRDPLVRAFWEVAMEQAGG